MIGLEYCSVSPIRTRYALQPTPQRDYKLESYCSYNSASLNLCPLFILFISSSPLSFVDLLHVAIQSVHKTKDSCFNWFWLCLIGEIIIKLGLQIDYWA